MTVPVLPRSVLSPPAGSRVAVIGGLGASACALAGFWIRIDDGTVYRLVLAVTSFVFGALVLRMALEAKTRTAAIFRAGGMSIVLGAASTVLPIAILCATDNTGGPGMFVGGLMFGLFFGGATGFVYGVLLAMLAGVTWKGVQASTHDARDRAVRAAAAWALVPAVVCLALAFVEDGVYALAPTFDVAGATLAVGVAAAGFFTAKRRIARRRAWVTRTLASEDLGWSVRAPGPDDDLSHLPRLGEGGRILEYREAAGAYRVAASATPIAVL